MVQIVEDDCASEVRIEKSVIVEHGEETDNETIIKEALHKIQTGRGKIENTDIYEK